MKVPLAALVLVLAVACSSVPTLAPNQLVADGVYSAIRTDGAYVYYIDAAANVEPRRFRFVRVPIGGGAVEVLSQLPTPRDPQYMAAFIIDGSSAFCPVDGKIIAVPLQGGTATTIVDEGVESIQVLASDATSLFWLEGDALPPWSLDARLVTVPKTGGAPTVLATSGLGTSVTAIAVTDSALYWPGASCSVSDPTCVAHNDVIWTLPKSGGTPASWTTSASDALTLASDAVALYWLDASDGSLHRAPQSSPTNMTLLATGISAPSSTRNTVWSVQLTANGGIRWIDGTGNGIYSLLDGAVTAVSSDTQIKFFALDTTNMYWATSAGIFYARL